MNFCIELKVFFKNVVYQLFEMSFTDPTLFKVANEVF